MLHGFNWLLVFGLIWLCLAGIEGSPVADGNLVCVYQVNSENSCRFVRIDYKTGAVTPVVNSTICADETQAAAPASALDRDRSTFYVLTGSGKYLFAIDIRTGSQRQFPLPSNYATILGLVFNPANRHLYLVTSTTIYDFDGTSFSSFLKVSFGDSGVATISSDGKTIFVAENTGKVTQISIAQKASKVIFTYGFNPIDLQYYSPSNGNDSLIILANYKLYSLSLSNTQLTFLLNIPDGDGFPITNTIYSPLDLFFFADIDKVYSISLTAKKVLTNAVFNGYRCIGNFVYITA